MKKKIKEPKIKFDRQFYFDLFKLIFQTTKWYLLGIFLFFVFYCSVNQIEPTEIGISRNFITGHMESLESGWYLTPPWVGVAHIDTRPMRLILSTSGRSYSGKLVQFNHANWQEFVNNEGWRYYWWDNRLSLNLGSGFEESRGLPNILRGYAYSTKKYGFIKILSEL